MDQEILSALVNASHETIMATDYSGEILFCNYSSTSLFGLTVEELKKENFFNLLYEQDLKEMRHIVRLLPEHGKSGLSYLARFKNANNDLPLKVEAKKLSVQGNMHLLFIITPHTKEEEEAHKLYRLLAENAYDINIMFENDELIYVSPSVRDFLGYEEAEIVSMDTWLALIYKEDRNEYLSQLGEDRRNKAPFSYYTYRQRHKDGRYRWFETKIRREFRESDVMVEMATSVDITTRKKFEKELALQKEFIEQLFDTDPNLIFVRDGNRQMIYCNRAVAELVGMTRDEFLSVENNMFPATPDQTEKYFEMEQRVINQGEELMLEEQIPDSKGVIHYYQTIKKPLKTQDGDVSMLNISTNIDRIKYYEKETQNAMKARNEFFSSMSHEIRTPMNAILGMAELLISRNPRKDQVKLLKTLQYSSKGLLTLINDILDFSKIESGKIEVEAINFNLRELAENVLVGLRPKALDKDLKISSRVDQAVPEVVNGDYVKLNQILNNLLGNAIKFTDRGKIELVISMTTRSDKEYMLRFDVIDTGIGIEAEKLKFIFEPFHQANTNTTRLYGGTGLGLTIVKNLVELQKGTIEVKSQPGEGSTFSVKMPFKFADKGQSINHLPDTKIRDFKWKMKLKVLYVEDVSTNQFLIEEILGDWGVKVIMASDGFEALELIKDKSYDLILMDIQMPGIDGLETTRRIRALNDKYFQNIPILALTASTTEATRDEVFLSGMQDFVLKPIDVNDLRTKIVEHTHRTDEFKDIKIIDTGIPVEEKNTKIVFDQTDKLFLGNLVRYQEFLKMTIEEFRINLDLLKSAILDGDLNQFRALRHRMKSIMATFGMAELLRVLDNVKSKMQEENMTARDKKEFNQILDYHIQFLLDSLSNKLASLKWQ